MHASPKTTFNSLVQLLAFTTTLTATIPTAHAYRLREEALQENDQNRVVAAAAAAFAIQQPQQQQQQQHPINEPPSLPTTTLLHIAANTMPFSTAAPQTMENQQVLLSDVLGRDRSINIFASYARDAADVISRLDERSDNSTVLAPLNSAVEALPRKPWEDPPELKQQEQQQGQGEEDDESSERERAQRNLKRFVEAHVVPKSPWGEGEKVGSLLEEEGGGGDKVGGEIWWEWKDGKEKEGEGVRVIQPDGIEVEGVASRVGNGEVWVLRGVRNYYA